MSSLGSRLWHGWLAVAGRFGEVQTLLVLGVFYVLVIGPAAVIAAALRADLLDKRRKARPGSAWRSADSRPPTLDNLKQPF